MVLTEEEKQAIPDLLTDFLEADKYYIVNESEGNVRPKFRKIKAILKNFFLVF